jgi:2-methylcitrate dehydratase PrpD
LRSAAKFVKDIEFGDLDEATIQMAKSCLLDFVGCVLGGAKTKAGRITLEFAKKLGGPPQSTIWCNGEKTSSQNAAFTHGTIGSALDMDDGHRMAVGHPGGAVIPAAFSVAESNQSTGKELIEAIVCGYEVAIRSGNIHRFESSRFAMTPGTGRWGSIGAAAAVAKLLSLNLEQIEQSIAISGTYAPIAPVLDDLKKGFMPMTKYSSGWGALVGLFSAFLANEGFTGISSTIDFSSSSLPSFGEFFEIQNVYFKPFPCCRWTHPAIEGVLELMNRHKDYLKKESIKKISIKIFSNGSHLCNPYPQTMESAQYSIPFLVGVAVLHGKVTPDQIVEERLSDHDVLSIAKKVEIIHDPRLDEYFPRTIPTIIQIENTSGRSYETKVTTPKGDPKNPMTTTELVDKFRSLSSKSVDSKTAEEIIKNVNSVDKMSTISELTVLF